MLTLTILATLLFTLTMASTTNEILLELIIEQQRHIEFLIKEIEDIKQKPLLEERRFTKISELILEKTKDSFRMPNISYKIPDINYEKGIKYTIEKKQGLVITNIDDLQIVKNVELVNPTIWYEIKFYIESNIPDIPYIPIYDEDNLKKPPSRRNIFRVNDTTHRFIPKIFYEIKTTNGEIDIVQDERLNLF